MQLATLEDNNLVVNRPMRSISLTGVENQDARSIGTAVPHFSWLTNPTVLYDIAKNEKAVSGSAFGVTGAAQPTGFGVFTDRVGNTIIVAMENYPGDVDNHWHKAFLETGAYGTDPIVIDVMRGSGGGFIERVLMPRFNQMVVPQLERIESMGRQGRPILVRIQGAPITWRRVFELTDDFMGLLIDVALQVAAPYLGPLVGATASQVAGAAPLLKNLAQGKPVQVRDLASAAALVAPKDLQAHIPAAQLFVEHLSSGNYAAAAGVASVSVGKVQDLQKGIVQDVSETANKIAQNSYVMSVVNTVRAKVESGSAKMNIIDDGTMTKNLDLQNLLLAAASSITVGVPRVQEIAGVVATQTNDITSAAEHRALLQMAMGYPVTPGSVDRLALRGLIERAQWLRGLGKSSMMMPAMVPSDKRSEWADQISQNSGISVRTGQGPSATTLALGAAASAGILYFLMK